MFTGIFAHGVESVGIGLIIAVLAISAVLLTVGYTFLAVKRAFFGPLNPALANGHHELKDPPLTMILPLLFTVSVSIFLGLYPSIFMNFFHQVIG